MLFSSAGLGFFIYGKRQSAISPMACGLALMMYPYFVSSVIVLVIIGLVLMVLPYFLSQGLLTPCGYPSTSATRKQYFTNAM